MPTPTRAEKLKLGILISGDSLENALNKISNNPDILGVKIDKSEEFFPFELAQKSYERSNHNSYISFIDTVLSMSREYAESHDSTEELQAAIRRHDRIAKANTTPSQAELLSKVSMIATDFSGKCETAIRNLRALEAEKNLKLMEKDTNTYNSLMSAIK